MRFERTTYGLGIRCSILLSYGGNMFIYNKLVNIYIEVKKIDFLYICHHFATNCGFLDFSSIAGSQVEGL